jgi:hypothetical protein
MNSAEVGQHKARSYAGDYMDIGKQGEKVVMEWLACNPAICGIIDFRNIRKVDECDIDCGVKLYTGQVCLAEIKTDTHLGTKRRNVLCEVLRINHHCSSEFTGYLGWTLRSPAKILLCYAPNWEDPNTHIISPKIYRGTFSAIRKTIQRCTKSKPIKQFLEVRTDAQKTTYNLLIPECEFTNVFTICDVQDKH